MITENIAGGNDMTINNVVSINDEQDVSINSDGDSK